LAADEEIDFEPNRDSELSRGPETRSAIIASDEDNQLGIVSVSISSKDVSCSRRCFNVIVTVYFPHG